MQTHSEPCFSTHYRRYRRLVGHVLRRVGVPETDLDDLSQEVFMVLLQHMRELTETDRLMPWLRQVARRVASNHRRGVLRRRRRQPRWSEPIELEDPERALARAEAAGFLADFFDELDPQARPVFLLSEVEGLPGPQIAEQLGLNLNTTYSRIRSVRRRFTRAVDEQRQSRPAWLAVLPSLLSPPTAGPAGWIAVALRMSMNHKLLGVVTALVVAVGLVSLTRGSCSVKPQGLQAAPTNADERRDRPTMRSSDDTAWPDPPLELGATVTGRVTDLAGASIPGAQVCTAREAAVPPRCVLADTQGVYSLRAVPAGAAWVGASARGYVSLPAFDGQPNRTVRVPTIGTVADVDLLLRPGGRETSGIVRDIAGGPIEGATVVSLQDDGLLATTRVTTDANGRFSMWSDASSVVRVVASAEGYVPREQLRFFAAGDTFDLALFPEAVIEGRVIDAETRAGLPDVLVEVPQRNARTSTARTDPSGRFRLAGLHPGRHKPRVRDGSWLGYAQHAVAIGLGETVDDVVVEAHGARHVSGYALQEDGRPCTEGRVTMQDASGEVANSQRPNALGRVDIGGLRPGEYTVVVSCTMPWEGAPGSEFTVDLLDADVEDAEWEVAEDRHGERTLGGSVVGPGGEPVPYARLEMVLVGGLKDGGLFAPLTLADRDGRFSFEHLPSGKYGVSITMGGFASHFSYIEIEQRDLEVELSLQAGVDLRVHAKTPGGTPVPGVKIKVAATFDRSSVWIETNAEGWALASDLKPETYQLIVSRPGVGGKAGPEDPSRWEEGSPLTLEDDTEHTVVVPSRDGIIGGRAQRTDGDPVADASVVARSSETYLDYVGERRTAIVAEARTDAEGNFVLEGLETSTFTVSVRDAFGQTASHEGVEPETSLTFELPEPGVVRGSVEIEGEDPPEQFTITVTPKSGTRYSESFLRTEGEWSIVGVSPGLVRVEVHSPWGTAQAKTTVKAGAAAAPLTLKLAPRGSIRGRLVGPDGEPVAGVSVVVLSDHGPASGAIGTSNADGVFELANAPSGSVVVKVVAIRDHRAKRIPTTVPPGGEVDLKNITLEVRPTAAP